MDIPLRIMLASLLILSASLEAADETLQLEHAGQARTCIVHIPPQYDGTPLPLVLFLHGGTGTAKHAARAYDWNEKADAKGFIVAYPNGTGMVQTWNAVHCCGASHRSNVDDIGFINALLDTLAAKWKIDPKRIYATGMSNGGMLSHRIGSELSQRIAAIAPVAGSIGGQESESATEKRIKAPAVPVPVLMIHGLKDENVPYNGGPAKGLERGRIDLSVAEAVKFWVKINNCKNEPVRQDLAGGAVKETYSSDTGNDVVLVSWDGGHSWPPGLPFRRRGGETISATDLAWEFFETHPKK